jgi:hypothetical protein
VAGQAAVDQEQKDNIIIEELSKLLSCRKEQIPSRIEEIFLAWKEKKKKGRGFVFSSLSSKVEFHGDILGEGAKILKTQKEHLISTVNRFLEDLKK